MKPATPMSTAISSDEISSEAMKPAAAPTMPAARKRPKMARSTPPTTNTRMKPTNNSVSKLSLTAARARRDSAPGAGSGSPPITLIIASTPASIPP